MPMRVVRHCAGRQRGAPAVPMARRRMRSKTKSAAICRERAPCGRRVLLRPATQTQSSRPTFGLSPFCLESNSTKPNSRCHQNLDESEIIVLARFATIAVPSSRAHQYIKEPSATRARPPVDAPRRPRHEILMRGFRIEAASASVVCANGYF